MADANITNLTDKQRASIMMPLLIGGFISLMNQTLLHVAFPQLIASLHVSINTVQWLATAYLLIIGILGPVVAFLMKTFPTRTLYMTAMTLFIVGTISCGLSQSFPALLISRMIQGAGTGMLIPIMMSVILEIFPPAKRGAAMGICLMVIVVAPGIGPTLSGLVLQYLNWHWLFFLILPFALLAVILGAKTLRNVTTLTSPAIDVLSIVLSTIGFGGLIFGIGSIVTLGFFSPTVIISLIGGIGGLIGFSKRQLTIEQPMLDLRVFRYPMFTLGIGIMFITFMLPFAVNVILPTYMQSALGLMPFGSGLALLPGSIICGVITPLSGRFYDKAGAKQLAIAGFAVLSAVMLCLSHITAATTLISLIALQASMSLGISLIITPIQTNSLNHIPKEHGAHGVAVLNTVQQISAAFGCSLFIGLMGSAQAKSLGNIRHPSLHQRHMAAISGVNTAFTATLIMVLIGLVLSLFLHHRKGAPIPRMVAGAD